LHRQCKWLVAKRKRALQKSGKILFPKTWVEVESAFLFYIFSGGFVPFVVLYMGTWSVKLFIFEGGKKSIS